MIVSTRKKRETWARKKVKELGKDYNQISFGKTHASFMKGEGEDFSGVQIAYPDSILNIILKWLIGILVILFKSLFAGGVSFVISGLLFGEGIVTWIFIIIGAIVGLIWGIIDFKESY